MSQWVDLEYMRWWQAVGLFALLAVPVILLACRSLAGLGPVRRWVALAARLLVLLVLVLLVAGLQLRRRNADMEVMVLWDISPSVNLYTDFPPAKRTLDRSVEDYLLAASQKDREPQDAIGLIFFKDRALINSLPNENLIVTPQASFTAGGTTDIAGAVQLALASYRKDTLRRVLLISDGNQTAEGSIDAAIDLARSQGVPIDVMPLRYSVRNDVMIEQVGSARQWRRENEPFTLDVVLKNSNLRPVSGKLVITHNDQIMGDPIPVTLKAGAPRPDGQIEPHVQVQHVPVPELKSAGAHEFKARFEGAEAEADVLGQNNESTTFVMVRGKGRILYVRGSVPPGAETLLLSALREGGLLVDVVAPDGVPADAIRLQGYDAVLLASVSRGSIGEEQDRTLAAYVHDMGGGLIMLGGPDSFGAGGWQGSQVEKVLPVNMEIPAQRQMPKGALVMVMHSCEFENGNYWGEQCAIKAVEALGYLDEVGVVNYGNTNGGAGWVYPLQTKQNGAAAINAIKRMMVGDMPSFEDSMQVALNGVNGVGPALARSDAARKHVIVISDGDPTPPTPATLAAYRQAGVTISTVPVFPHVGDAQGIPPTMRSMAIATGGRAYPAINNNPNQLPQIFIKEATTVRRTLIQKSSEGFPITKSTTSDVIAGMKSFPPVFGFVLATKKPDPQVVMPLSVTMLDHDGKAQLDPLLVQWQSGLGRAAAFTSDAHNDWAANWAADRAMFGKFWTQLVRSVARSQMSSDYDIQVTRSGNHGHIRVEALNEEQRFRSFLDIGGTVSGPNGVRQEVRLMQKGPGEYEAEFDTRAAGNYVVMLNYASQIKGESGWLMSGTTVSANPEFRDLRSNDARLAEIAERTGGRVLTPWDAQAAKLYSRENVRVDSWPRDVRGVLIPILIALLLLDVAIRRVALGWATIRRAMTATSTFVRTWTLTKPVESAPTLDALKRVRGEVADVRFRQAGNKSPASTTPMPNRTAKFEAKKAIEGDIAGIVGGATDKPLPKAPPAKKPAKAEPTGGFTNSLLEAKKRAQKKIKEREEGDNS